MAGPSSIAENDSIYAMRLQLKENGAGDVPISSLLDCPQHAPSDPLLQSDAALACSIMSDDLKVVQDAVTARHVALRESGLNAAAVECLGSNRELQLNVSQDPTECPICSELVCHANRFLSSSCGHTFCHPCMRKYLTVSIEGKRYPINCPTCREGLDSGDCLSALAGLSGYKALEKLIIEREHCKDLRYCANVECNLPFDWIDDPDQAEFSDRYKVQCLECGYFTCVECKTLWHFNRTCNEAALGTECTNQFRQLARQNGWTQCPQCGHTIERQRGDCNYVKCICGCGFCHRCGKKYIHQRWTAQNYHGKPACHCGLFNDHVEPEGRLQLGIRVEQVNAPRPPEVEAAIERPFHRREPDYHEHHRIGIAIAHAVDQSEDEQEDEQADEAAEEDQRFVEGPNGYVSIPAWIYGPRRYRLPENILHYLERNICPYRECHREFVDTSALEKHLVSVQRHDVWLCCGRPFMTENGVMMHGNAVH